jgi:prepilin-type N-terminal cleavage/methylation domain-containing protein
MFYNKSAEYINHIRNRGFTLIEVLIAITLFAIGILAVASLQATAINGNATAKRHSEAATLAVDRIEKLKRTGYDLVSGNETVEVPGGTYKIAWTVCDQNSCGNPPAFIVARTQFVDVTVVWQDAGKTKSLAFRFLKANKVLEF